MSMRKLMAIGVAAVPGYLYLKHRNLQQLQAVALEAETKLLAVFESGAPKDEKVLRLTEAAVAYARAAEAWQYMEKMRSAGRLAIPVTGVAALALLANR